jgi:uncharacterized membrane protein
MFASGFNRLFDFSPNMRLISRPAKLVLLFPQMTPSIFRIGIILKIMLHLNCYASYDLDNKNLIKPWRTQLACVSPG